MEPENITLANTGDLLSDHLENGWSHLVRAYNTAKNAGQHDTAGGIAFAIAEASAVIEYTRRHK
jgi:hypothetical protein